MCVGVMHIPVVSSLGRGTAQGWLKRSWNRAGPSWVLQAQVYRGTVRTLRWEPHCPLPHGGDKLQKFCVVRSGPFVGSLIVLCLMEGRNFRSFLGEPQDPLMGPA